MPELVVPELVVPELVVPELVPELEVGAGVLLELVVFCGLLGAAAVLPDVFAAPLVVLGEDAVLVLVLVVLVPLVVPVFVPPPLLVLYIPPVRIGKRDMATSFHNPTLGVRILNISDETRMAVYAVRQAAKKPWVFRPFQEGSLA